MINTLKKIESLFKRKIFYSLIFLYFCLIILTVFEFIGIGSIPILITMLIEPGTNIKLFGVNIIEYINQINFFDNNIITLGSVIILVFFIKSIFLIFLNIFELLLKKKMKLVISKKLILTYLKRPFIYFINSNTSKLSKDVINESDQCVTYISSLIVISREISIVSALFLVMLYFEPLLAIYIFLTITLLVAIFLYSTDSKLKNIAIKRWGAVGEVFKSVGNVFGGIKDIKVFKRDQIFIEKFAYSKKEYEDVMQLSEFIRRLPKIILEFFTVIFLVGLTVAFIYLNKSTLDLIPVLSLIAVTVIRFIPSFNSIAAEMTHIKVYKLAFENVGNEILNSIENVKNTEISPVENNDHAVEVENVNYSYVNNEKNISSLKNLSINIKKGSITGIIGRSGAGKSTLINIILGLLTPQSGSVKIQNIKKQANVNNSQVISYVPQDIFLTDDTLKNNIAFGFKEDEIDIEKIMMCLKDSGLSELIDSNEKGIDMPIGEKGIKLSGGEKQRLGLARALYVQPEILILDEATSSLDNETERNVIATIRELKKNVQ